MYDLSKPSHRKAIERQANDLLRGRPAKTKMPRVTKMPKDDWTKDTREKLLGKRNEAEWKMRKLLAECKALHHRERPIEVDGKKYFIDFLVSGIRISQGQPLHRVRVALEVDGGYHFTEEQTAKDRKKDCDLLKSSRVWSVLRVSSEVAMTMTAQHLKDQMLAMRQGSVVRLY